MTPNMARTMARNPAVLEGWLAHPDTNDGIALTSTKSRIIGFYTFDDTSVSPNFKPSLLVKTVPEPAAASGLAAGVRR